MSLVNFSNLPNEILLNILLFFDRNELERLESVARRFKDMVNAYSDFLPLRLIKEINAKNYTFKYALMTDEDHPIFSWELDKWYRIEIEERLKILPETRYNALKSVVIEAFVMVCNVPIGEEQWNVEELFRRLQEIRASIGKPLVVKNFFFKNSVDEIANYFLDHMNEMFRNFMQVDKANLGFYYINYMKRIFETPSILEVKYLPMKVFLRCGYCWSEESTVRVAHIMSFLTKMNNLDREYDVVLCYAEENFVKNLKSELKRRKNDLPKLPKKFVLSLWSPDEVPPGTTTIDINDIER